MAAGAGVGLVGGGSGLGLMGHGLHRVERRSWALGAEVYLVAYHEEEDAADQAISKAFEALDEVEEALSLYRPHSGICRLNRTGTLDAPPADLVTVLCHALEWARRTRGAFDPTIQPLWGLHARGPQPGLRDLEAALDRVDWRQVESGEEQIRLGQGQAITLNGIAQGFAADRVRAVLARHGVRHALVNTGEIGGFGRKPKGESWRVGIQHPRHPEAFIALATFSDRVLATSGDYETAFSPGFERHHILDPATGASPGDLSSVSILAPSGVEADALSTAVFVLGPDRGMELIATRKGVDALLVLKDGRVVSTPSFPGGAA